MRVRTDSKVVMADVLIHVVNFARYSAHDFVLGPFNEAKLMGQGLVLEGDIAELRASLTRAFADRDVVMTDD